MSEPAICRRLQSSAAGLAIMGEVPGADVMVDGGAGTGIFSRQLGALLPVEITITGIESSASMRAQAVAETTDNTCLEFSDGVAEALPFIAAAARAVVAATAAYWFARPAFYAEAHRILVPGCAAKPLDAKRGGCR